MFHSPSLGTSPLQSQKEGLVNGMGGGGEVYHVLGMLLHFQLASLSCHQTTMQGSGMYLHSAQQYECALRHILETYYQPPK